MVFAPGEGLPGITVETGEPVWIEDVMERRAFPRRARARTGRVETALGFPVLVGAEAVAMVEVFTRPPGQARRGRAGAAEADRDAARARGRADAGARRDRPPGAARPAHRPSQPRAAPRSAALGAGAVGAIPDAHRGPVHRPRPLQGRERQPRAQRGRPAAGGGGATPRRALRPGTPWPPGVATSSSSSARTSTGERGAACSPSACTSSARSPSLWRARSGTW